jgi:hypothetical protein
MWCCRSRPVTPEAAGPPSHAAQHRGGMLRRDPAVASAEADSRPRPLLSRQVLPCFRWAHGPPAKSSEVALDYRTLGLKFPRNGPFSFAERSPSSAERVVLWQLVWHPAWHPTRSREHRSVCDLIQLRTSFVILADPHVGGRAIGGATRSLRQHHRDAANRLVARFYDREGSISEAWRSRM